MNTETKTYTLSEPRWKSNHTRNPKSENRICEIRGLLNSYGSESPALVDAAIADLIIEMNEVGLETSFCCSALDADHRGEDWLHSGYIAFHHNLPRDFVTLLGDYMEGKTVIRLNRTSDKQMQESWAFIRAAFQTWLNN